MIVAERVVFISFKLDISWTLNKKYKKIKNETNKEKWYKAVNGFQSLKWGEVDLQVVKASSHRHHFLKVNNLYKEATNCLKIQFSL